MSTMHHMPFYLVSCGCPHQFPLSVSSAVLGWIVFLYCLLSPGGSAVSMGDNANCNPGSVITKKELQRN